MKKICLLPVMTLMTVLTAPSQSLVSFEQFALPENSRIDGFSSTLGSFDSQMTIDEKTFENNYSRSDWGYGLTETFSGFAYSRVTDNSTPGYTNQYSCVAGSGAEASTVYGLFYAGFGPQSVRFQEAKIPGTLAVCNNTYAYFSMLQGDAFSKKFGGDNGDDPDFFLLTITGYLDGAPTDTIRFYLADYRFEDNDLDYIITDWTMIELAPLGQTDEIRFSLSSSDTGDWGMNTPAYFCIDNFDDTDFEDQNFLSGDYWNGYTAALGAYHSSIAEETVHLNNVYTLSDWGYGMSGSFTGWAVSNLDDTTTPGYTNQYSAIPGSGANETPTYALCYNSRGTDTLFLDTPATVESLAVTNGTYPYLSMSLGDAFAKKFGGADGTDPDFFRLHITGMLDGQPTGTVDFYLADFRFEDPSLDYIINEWESVDLRSLGTIDQIHFSLSSSDTGDWGMNTPAYFFIDEIALSITAGSNNLTLSEQISLYPNPADNYFHVTSPEPISRIEVYSLSGQVMQVNDYQPADYQRSISIEHLKPGMYLVKMQSRHQLITKRLLKN